ncbi:endospore germination permease [Paenibacillus sp. FSL H8-0261]|uniref:GerAB/ArcD/ProY family transporter n=1 Tax=Paenibacillus sp. FSL H8-0261 TaxID=2921381 RepID=UPI0032547FA1
MKKEIIPTGHSISIVVLFIIGTSLFMGLPGKSGNSSWIALLFAISLTVPLLFIYARFHVLFPGKNLFDILIIVFGSIFGRVVSCMYIWYALHMGALVLRNFGEFSKTVALTETPMIAPMLCVGLLCIWVVKAGIEVIGRCAKLFLLLLLAEVLFIEILAIPKLKYHYLKPFLDSGWSPIFADTFGSFTFPFAEIVLFMGVFSHLPAKDSAKKILLSGLLISGGVILLVSLRNLLILNPDIVQSLYFPSYVAVSRINIGDFLTRMEASSALGFVITIFIKASLCLYVASVGVAKLFKLKSYRSVVLQLGLIMVYFSRFIFKDIMEMQHFAYTIYPIYALPFQVIIPLVLWICAEIKVSKSKNKQVASQQ